MPYRAHFRSLAVVTVFTLVVTLALFIPNASANDGDDASAPAKPTLTYPNLGSALNQLVSNVQEGRMSASEAAGGASISSGGSVAVTIHLSGYVSELETFLGDNGGDVRNVGSDYIEAYVPVTLLGPVSEQPGVLRVREIIPPQPTQLTQQVIGHGPAVHGSMPWNEAGYGGQGVKIGVIDLSFRGVTTLLGTELPSTIVARCYEDVGAFTNNLYDCEPSGEAPTPLPGCPSETPSPGGHGTIVAESVFDMAPGVTLYVADPVSRGDLLDTVEWMAAEGVQVINYSVGYIFDGPGDGTSPLSVSPLNTVDRAVEKDILWVNSAGNAGQDTWFGGYSDSDGDSFLDFGGPIEEFIGLPLYECERSVVQLRWEDSWTGARTDLDLHLYDKSTNKVIFSSDDPQSGEAGQVPWEAFVTYRPFRTNDLGIKVTHHSGKVPDWIQIVAWTVFPLEPHTLRGSITNPAESANPGLLAVGAAPWFDVNTIEPFSSRGPTPDDRVKPDIVGADCGETAFRSLRFSSRLGGDCGFAGTSQASPHVAGLAGLVRQRFPDFTAEQTAAYLKNNAEPRGAVPNNTWGYGLAQLPATDVGDCVHELTADGTTSGQWSPSCQSIAADRGYSQYYTFTPDESAQVTITLSSSVDPYLFLREGDARSGDFVDENDDIEAGANTNSRITATLTAGTYTIEATTYDTAKTGDFTLTISGLGGGTGGGGTTPDGCGFTISADGTVSGTWAAGCQSAESARGYARYYSFTTTEARDVTITVNSSVDSYLYLRRGTSRTGAALNNHQEDDDAGGDRNAQVSETLTAGEYTLEVTTYSANETGSFTLTVSGLAGTTTDPDPGTGDSCGEAITADGAVSGTWAAGCQSAESARGYARYYSFTTTEARDVTITLESTTDPYLYLRSGDRTGSVEAQNDDYGTLVNNAAACASAGGLGNTDSCITIAGLSAGTYTIEATTYSPNETGSFTLTLSGLAGTTTDPGPGTGDSCGEAITADGAVSGTWAAGCESGTAAPGAGSGARLARYYTFSLAQQSTVTIVLESTEADTYLYLRSGEARSGTSIDEDDDTPDTTRSEISETLDAGTYTIEATTYSPNETGSFTLTVSGLGGTTTDPDPGTGDSCGEAISGDGAVSGTWAAGCQSQHIVTSQHPNIVYARYYTFTLAQESQVTIDLESSVDTYLYLRAGDARTGTALHENDDVDRTAGNYDSQISETLAAGTYTIEATTYNANEAGGFTLTVAGLGEGGTSTGG